MNQPKPQVVAGQPSAPLMGSATWDAQHAAGVLRHVREQIEAIHTAQAPINVRRALFRADEELRDAEAWTRQAQNTKRSDRETKSL